MKKLWTIGRKMTPDTDFEILHFAFDRAELACGAAKIDAQANGATMGHWGHEILQDGTEAHYLETENGLFYAIAHVDVGPDELHFEKVDDLDELFKPTVH